MLAFIADHQSAPVPIFCDLDRFLDAPQNTFTNGIHFTGKLKAQNLVTDIMYNDFVVFIYRGVGTDISQIDLLFSSGYRFVVTCGHIVVLAVTIVCSIECAMPLFQHLTYPRRYRKTLGLSGIQS